MDNSMHDETVDACPQDPMGPDEQGAKMNRQLADPGSPPADAWEDLPGLEFARVCNKITRPRTRHPRFD